MGLNGKVAIAFAILIKQLWSCSSPRSLSPSKLRDLIAEKYAHFRGFEQQDTQEFLCSLLSLLHEDLNRVLKKPFYESSLECEDDSIAQTCHVAQQSWLRHLSRDNSVIVENFYGQFKSKLTCPECARVSITFEPFNNLLVPLAKPKRLANFIVVFNGGGGISGGGDSDRGTRGQCVLNLCVSGDETVDEVQNKVRQLIPELRNSLVSLKNNNNKNFKIFKLN